MDEIINEEIKEKGLTKEQFDKIIDFVQLYHRLGFIKKEKRILKTESGINDHHNIVYVDGSYDTRDENYWQIKLRGPSLKITFNTNEIPENFSNLFVWIMAFLNGEWKPLEKINLHEPV